MLNLFKKLKKQKPVLACVTVTLDNHEGHTIKQVIYVPHGYHFVKEFAECDRLLDENGNIFMIYDWKPGYTCTYEYTYAMAPEED